LKRTLACLAAAALAALAAGCMSEEERVQRHLESAAALMEAWQSEQALLELQSALKLDPRNVETNLRLAEAYEYVEAWDDALFYFEEAHRLDPALDAAALGVARLLRFADTDRAEQALEQVLKRNPGSAQAHMLRSDVLLVREKLDEALAEAHTAAELDPESALIRLHVGMVHKAFIAQARRTGAPGDPRHFEAADESFGRALELAKAGDPFWIVRGTIEQASLLSVWRGHGEHVVRAYQDGFEAVKPYRPLALRLCRAAVRHARLARDQEFLHWALSRGVELEPGNFSRWTLLAELEDARGGSGTAVLKRMLEQSPTRARAHVTYAEYLANWGMYAEAVAHLESALDIAQPRDRLLSALVSLELASGDREGAQGSLARLQAEFPDSPQRHYAEARFAGSEGRTGDAIAALGRWVEREESAVGYAMLAEARLNAGEVRAALEDIDRALALDDDEPAHHRLRGRILLRLGDHRSALRAFRRGGRGRVPKEVVPEVAQALYSVGRHQEARGVLAPLLEQEPPPADALLLFARGEAERDPPAARRALERGAASYPQDARFVELLVASDHRAGHGKEALARAQEAAQRLPDSLRAQLLLARALVVMEQLDEAVRQTERVRERWAGQPDVAALYLEVMTRAGRGEEAFRALSEQHAAGTLPVAARSLLARLHRARGEEEQAIALLRSALADGPGLPGVANDLAYLLARRGESLPEATELAQEARASRPDSAEIADTLGYVYLRRGLADAALAQFEAALELSEAGSRAWATAKYHRGLALRELDRPEEAVAALEEALASGADFAEAPEAHRLLAELAKLGAEARRGGS
jgi:tetratricopeptide (TPR) repeat protein